MEILNQTEYYVNSGFIDGITVAGILLTLFLFISLFIALMEGEKGAVFGYSVAVILIGFGTFSAYIHATEKAPQYEVKISDFNEVHEKGYEVVEQRGQIYVVRKKEAE